MHQSFSCKIDRLTSHPSARAPENKRELPDRGVNVLVWTDSPSPTRLELSIPPPHNASFLPVLPDTICEPEGAQHSLPTDPRRAPASPRPAINLRPPTSNTNILIPATRQLTQTGHTSQAIGPRASRGEPPPPDQAPSVQTEFDVSEIQDAAHQPNLPEVASWAIEDDIGDPDYVPSSGSQSQDSSDHPSVPGEDDQLWNMADLAEEELYFADIDHRTVQTAEEAPTPSPEPDDEVIKTFEQVEGFPAGEPVEPPYDEDPGTEDDLLSDPWHPFVSEKDYRLARWFVFTGVPTTAINAYFNENIGDNSEPYSFCSAHTLRNQIARMAEQLPKWNEGTIGEGRKLIKFYWRDPIECIRYLIGQSAFANHMRFKPFRRERTYTETDSRGNERDKTERRYTDMSDSNWWWRTQKKLPPGATLVPIIGSSDVTRLTEFGGQCLITLRDNDP